MIQEHFDNDLPFDLPIRPQNPMASNLEESRSTSVPGVDERCFLPSLSSSPEDKAPHNYDNSFTLEDDQGRTCTPITFYSGDYENRNESTNQRCQRSLPSPNLQDVCLTPAPIRHGVPSTKLKQRELRSPDGSVISATTTLLSPRALQCPPPPSASRRVLSTLEDCSKRVPSKSNGSLLVNSTSFVPIHPPPASGSTRQVLLVSPKARRGRRSPIGIATKSPPHLNPPPSTPKHVSSSLKNLSRRFRIPPGCFQKTVAVSFVSTPPPTPATTPTRRTHCFHPASEVGLFATPHHNNDNEEQKEIQSPHASSNTQYQNETTMRATVAPNGVYRPRPSEEEDNSAGEYLDLYHSRSQKSLAPPSLATMQESDSFDEVDLD